MENTVMKKKTAYCTNEDGLKKGAWTAEEDELLASYVNAAGEGNWTGVPKNAGLKRRGKSCRLRWLNYLRPNIKRGNFSEEEEDLIIRLHKLLGNRWSLIAGRLPGRTDNEIKNYWNTTLSKNPKRRNFVVNMPWNPAKSKPDQQINATRRRPPPPPPSIPALIRTEDTPRPPLEAPSRADGVVDRSQQTQQGSFGDESMEKKDESALLGFDLLSFDGDSMWFDGSAFDGLMDGDGVAGDGMQIDDDWFCGLSETDIWPSF